MGNGNTTGAKAQVESGAKSFPIVLGHEFEGEVIATGPNVPEGLFQSGKSYAIFPWLGCDGDDPSCPQCSGPTETMNLCESPKTRKYIDGRNHLKGGGYSSHQLVPSYRYLLDYTGALPEGLGCVYMVGACGCISETHSAHLNQLLPVVLWVDRFRCFEESPSVGSAAGR